MDGLHHTCIEFQRKNARAICEWRVKRYCRWNVDGTGVIASVGGARYCNVCVFANALIPQKTRLNTIFIQHRCLCIFRHVPNFSSRTHFTHAIIPTKKCALPCSVCVQCLVYAYISGIGDSQRDAGRTNKTVILKLNLGHFYHRMIFALQISKSARYKLWW